MAATEKNQEPQKITDVRTAFIDIEKRSIARQKARKEASKKINDASKSRRDAAGTVQSGSGKLQGLSSLTNTLGTQYLKQ